MEIGQTFCPKCIRNEYGAGPTKHIPEGTLSTYGLKPIFKKGGSKIPCDKCGKKYHYMWRRFNLSE